MRPLNSLYFRNCLLKFFGPLNCTSPVLYLYKTKLFDRQMISKNSLDENLPKGALKAPLTKSSLVNNVTFKALLSIEYP